MLSETLYTVDEAANEVRLSPWTLWDLMKKGKLMRTKVAGKTFLRESELKKLIVDKVNKPRPAATHSRNKKRKRTAKLAEVR